MSISLDDVHHIATLARLGLNHDRVTVIAMELNTILGHMDALARVNTDSVSEYAGIDAQALSRRSDEGPPIPLGRPLASFAPSVRDGLLLVPRLSSHESAE